MYAHAQNLLDKDEIETTDLDSITSITTKYEQDGVTKYVKDFQGVENLNNLTSLNIVMVENIDVSEYDLSALGNTDDKLTIDFLADFPENLTRAEIDDLMTIWKDPLYHEARIKDIADLLSMIHNPNKYITVNLRSILYTNDYTGLNQNYDFILYAIYQYFPIDGNGQNYQDYTPVKTGRKDSAGKDTYSYTIYNEYYFPTGIDGYIFINDYDRDYTYFFSTRLDLTAEDKAYINTQEISVTVTDTSGVETVISKSNLLQGFSPMIYSPVKAEVEMSEELVNYLYERDLEEQAKGKKYAPFQFWFSSGEAKTRANFYEMLLIETVNPRLVRGVNDHTVNFESNGGTPVAPKTDVEDGEKISAPNEPTRDGYTFDAWYKEAALTNQWNFNVDVVTSDITLYAKWSPKPLTYTVDFESNGGSQVSPISNIINGSKIQEPTIPHRDGYQFVGWYKDITLSELWNFNLDVVTKNQTLYAKWSIDKNYYTVKFDSNGGSDVSPISRVLEGSRIQEPTVPSKENYTFVAWYKEATLENKWDFSKDTVNSDMVLYAKWKPSNSVVDPVEPKKPKEDTTPKTGVNILGIPLLLVMFLALFTLVENLRKRTEIN